MTIGIGTAYLVDAVGRPPLPPRPSRCSSRKLDTTCRAALAALILLAAHALPLAHAVSVPGARSETLQFAQGAPVASDATEPMAHSRDGDPTVVRFGADERYVIPDALVRSGQDPLTVRQEA